MGRVAGSGSHYTFTLTRHDGDLTPHTFGLPSVTTVIKRVLGGPPPEWGFKLAVEGVAQLLRDGMVLDGATDAEALKAELNHLGSTPYAARDAGAVRGTRVHSYFEILAETPDPEDWPSPEDGYEQAVLDWFRDRRPQPIAVEQPVWSLDHRFAGTVDLIYFDTFGNRVLTDLKTHKPASKRNPARVEDLLQLAAYRLAWNEMNPNSPIDRTSVLIVTEDGRALEDERGLTSEDFLAVLRSYHAITTKGAA